MTSLGILISGRGSNMAAILRAVRAGRIRARAAVVVSSRGDAAGLEAARRAGVGTEVVESRGYAGTREAYDRELAAALRRHGVGRRGGLVCLAGFMRVLGPWFVGQYRGRILNVHPALLPAFPGLGAQAQAIEYGAKVSGCTVHFVDEGVDTGPVVAQAAVRVMEGDTAGSLAARILAKEHMIYPEAVGLVAAGLAGARGRRAAAPAGPAAGAGRGRAAGAAAKRTYVSHRGPGHGKGAARRGKAGSGSNAAARKSAGKRRAYAGHATGTGQRRGTRRGRAKRRGRADA